MVDGVYDKDPHKYADAVRYDTLTSPACWMSAWPSWTPPPATLCRDNGLPILVFDLGQPANIAKAVKGESSVPWSGNKTQKHKLKNSYFPPILS